MITNMKINQEIWESIYKQRNCNFIRQFDQQEVDAIVSDDGLTKTYNGMLNFGTGNEDTLMIGLDEICIHSIKTINCNGVKFETPHWQLI